MKFKEYTIPVETVVDEAPMGLVKQGLTKLASKIPGSMGAKASGALQTGQNANAMYKEFYNYLGQTGQKPTTASVTAFLKNKGVSDAIIKKYVVAPAGSTAQYPKGDATQQPQTQQGGFKVDLKNMPQQTPAQQPTAPRQGFNVDLKNMPQQTPAQQPTAPRQGFKVGKKEIDRQTGQNQMFKAARNIQTGRTNESIELQKLLAKISKRL